MSASRYDYHTIRSYLLGRLAVADREEFEQRYFTDDELFKELQAAEDDLIDDFLTGDLSEDDVARFHGHFLVGAERKQKLRIITSYRKYALVHAGEPSKKSELVRVAPWQQLLSSPSLRFAGIAAVILIAAVGVWRIFIYQSDVDKGLIALNNAYRDQRPVESRITQINYAPFSSTRGGEPERVNSLERAYADSYFLNAVRDHPGADSYHALGQSYLMKKEFDQAITYFQEALKTDPNNEQIYADLGAAFLEKALTDKTGTDGGKSQADLARSREYLSKALERNPNLPEALFNRALVSEYQLVREQAEKDWQEYLTKDPNSGWATEAREHLKRLQEKRDRSSHAREQLLQDFLRAFESRDETSAWDALKRSRTRDGNGIVQALLDEYLVLSNSHHSNEAGVTLQKLFFAGQLERERAADRFTSDVVRFYSKANAAERASLAQARGQIKAAKELYKLNRFAGAVELYQQASGAFARLGDVSEALFADSWVGYCYLRIPKLQTSIELFSRLTREFEKRDYRSLFSHTLPALADAESSRNEFSRTLDYANRGLKISEEIEDHALGVRCLGQSLSMHLALGDYRQSLEALTRAVALADTIPRDPSLTWQLYFQAALAFDFLDFPASSLAFEEEARLLAEASKAPGLIARSWQRRGVLYAAKKNYEEAIRCGERALAEAQKVPGDVNVLARSRLILGKLHGQAGNPRESLAHLNQAIALYKNLDFHAYLYEAHKGKLMALVALADDATADRELRTVLKLFEQHRARIKEEGNRDRFFDADQDTYDLAVDFAYSRMNDETRAFEYAEASRARSLLEMMDSGARIIDLRGRLELELDSGTKPMGLSEIQRRMPEQAQILQYSLLGDKLIIWVITKHRIDSARIPVSQSELEHEIQDYTAALVRDTKEGTEAQKISAKKLYLTLITPVESLLDSRLQLSIVADKSLNYLPFATLISPSSSKYLIEDYALEMGPSASVFVSSSEQAKARGVAPDERLLSIGNPHFDRRAFPELRDLPAAGREAEGVGDCYPYPSPTVLVGDAAQADLIRRELKNFDVIHLATHAVADERSPLLSKLLLAKAKVVDASSHHAGRDFLQASEIYELELPRTRLVVLSACQTGIERAYRGEGAIGLARPFIAAGVPVVVASYWPVDSEATAELMISFHKYRRIKKLPTVKALRQAQLEMIHNSQPGTQRSNAWAAFVAIGGYADF